ncbi:MAG TPA: DUF6766 family protein, partial [Acidimicrobiia bacterium]|nr:DUF6766 family protein [Acidimicrobiia bacterium]
MTSLMRPSLRAKAESPVRRNALGLVCAAIFAVLVVALIFTGHQVYNQDQLEHGGSTISLWSYFGQGHFW